MWRDVERGLSGQTVCYLGGISSLLGGHSPPPRPGPGYTGGGLCQAFQVATHPDSLGTAQTPQWGPNAVRPGEATLLNNNNTIPGHRR